MRRERQLRAEINKSADTKRRLFRLVRKCDKTKSSIVCAGKEKAMNDKYDDIIDLPHHTSQKHPRMSIHDRAAQFSPFSALTGYGEAIKETARITGRRIDKDEQSRAFLNEKFKILFANKGSSNEVTVSYFVPDNRKKGGAYITVTGFVKKTDAYKKEIVMQDGMRIPIKDIFDINGEIFRKLDETFLIW